MKDFDGEQSREQKEQEDQEPEDLDLDGEDEGQEDEWEDGLEPSSGWLRILFIMGLTFLIVLLGAGIWYLTHSGGQDESEHNISHEGNQSSETIPESSAEDSAGPPEEPGGETADPPGGQTPEKEPEVSSGPEEDPGEESAGQAEADSDTEVQGEASGDVPMPFSHCQEEVTPKEVVNLRSAPTTVDDGNIVVQVKNGEVLLRTGINEDTGWSEIDYNGQTLYAVSPYLTTDLNYQPPATPSSPNRVSTKDGRIIVFVDCDDWVSPKEYANLRTEPSTSEGEDTVSCQLSYGENAHRTGYSPDSGWSRVEYDGQVLYVVSSLVYEVAAE